MSGIAGLVRFDGRSVTSRELERAANALNQYGPDRVEIIAKENIGLVHALMRMTPEDRFDTQPPTRRKWVNHHGRPATRQSR